MQENRIFEELKRRARYALIARSRDLVCEAYGAAKMASYLDAITKDEFFELNTMLVRNGINNPEAGLH